MPRRLLRDGKVVEDDWRYLTEVDPPADAGDVATTHVGATSVDAAPTDARAAPAWIIPLARWRTERDRWDTYPGNIGVILLPADQVEVLNDDLCRFSLVAAQFPGPADGRGYTQARLLRERFQFKGELRACGYVRRDQLFFLARCGFNSFELPDDELANAHTAFSTFSAEYQPSNDAGLSIELKHRQPAP